MSVTSNATYGIPWLGSLQQQSCININEANHGNANGHSHCRPPNKLFDGRKQRSEKAKKAISHILFIGRRT
jgi:hypothetical protein